MQILRGAQNREIKRQEYRCCSLPVYCIGNENLWSVHY